MFFFLFLNLNLFCNILKKTDKTKITNCSCYESQLMMIEIVDFVKNYSFVYDKNIFYNLDFLSDFIYSNDLTFSERKALYILIKTLKNENIKKNIFCKNNLVTKIFESLNKELFIETIKLFISICSSSKFLKKKYDTLDYFKICKKLFLFDCCSKKIRFNVINLLIATKVITVYNLDDSYHIY